MRNPRTRRLPQELIDIIIDYLHDDDPSLMACSLVCKSWIRSARYHLFAPLVLDQDGLEFLLRSNSEAIPFVRYISLDRDWIDQGHTEDGEYIPYEGEDDINDDIDDPSSYWNSFPSLLQNPNLNSFTRIKSLKLKELPWYFLTPRARSALINPFTTVIRLRLEAVKTTNLSQLAQIICAFPRIEALCLTTVTWDWANSDRPPSTLSLPHNLRILVFHQCRIRRLLKWFLSFRNTLAISTVIVRLLRSPDVRALNKFLHALGPSLEVVSIHPTFGDEDNAIVNLGYNTRLRYIHFRVWLFPPDSVNWIAEILSKVVSENVNTISFRVAFYPGSQTIPSGLEFWAGVDAVLVQPRFSNLKKVYLELEERREPGSVTWLFANFPLCQDRGILDVRIVR